MSYAHENPQLKANVLELALLLEATGRYHVVLDRWTKAPRKDWREWATREIANADFVLVIASPSYRAAAEGQCGPDERRNVRHEIAIILELLTSNREYWLPRIIPVILPGMSVEDVPLDLQPTTATYCKIEEVTPEGTTDLMELLSRPAGARTPRSPMSWRTRIMGRPITKRWTITAATATCALTATWLVTSATSTDDSHNIVGNDNDGNTSQNCQQGDCNMYLGGAVDEMLKSAKSEQDLIEKLRAKGTNAPTGDGPYPYLVVDTEREGLKARTGNGQLADIVGYAPEHSIVYAVCQLTGSFTPSHVRRDVGPEWMLVRWKNATATEIHLSGPSDPDAAWMYRGYLEPLGHNGRIPTCK